MRQQYVTAYAIVVEDKHDGVTLRGVYFGGAAATEEEAEQIARECVNKVRVTGGTVMPRVMPLVEGQLLDVMYEVQDKIEKLVARMRESHEIVTRPVCSCRK